MRITSLSQLLSLVLPLAALAFVAGALRALGLRQPDPRRARLLQVLWIVLLLAGTPAWLLLAAALGLV
ncbi:MAG: hypothetical protein HZB56_06845 [Deltaproteobacteria bacterium]|nr:hypothetical protein [Deltaproteobacteria bacterium]